MEIVLPRPSYSKIKTTIFIAILLAIAGAVAFLAPGGCATVQPVLVKVDHVVDCTASAVKSQLPSIVDVVATDLLSQNYAGLLMTLASQVGDDVVVCAVRIASGEASARMATGTQPNAATIKTNGEAYLAARGVKFAN